MDHFYYSGRLYLLVCDYFSKFPFIFQTKSTSFAYIKEQLEELLRLEGTPDEIMSDNGLPFSSREFNSFSFRSWYQTHPRHQTIPRVTASLKDKYRQ